MHDHRQGGVTLEWEWTGLQEVGDGLSQRMSQQMVCVGVSVASLADAASA